MSRELTLPSGKTLLIQPADFKTAKDLYKAFAEEFLKLDINEDTDVKWGVIKNLVCSALASDKIEKCLWECFKTVTIDKLKIDQQTFEPVDARDDWFTVCMEVARDNVLPFTRSLMPWFLVLLEKARSSLESESKTKEKTT